MEGARPARSGGRPPRALREGGRLGKPSTHGDKKRAALMASPICSTLHLHCTQLTASLRFGEQRHRLSRRGEGCRGCGLHGMRATGDIAMIEARWVSRMRAAGGGDAADVAGIQAFNSLYSSREYDVSNTTMERLPRCGRVDPFGRVVSFKMSWPLRQSRKEDGCLNAWDVPSAGRQGGSNLKIAYFLLEACWRSRPG